MKKALLFGLILMFVPVATGVGKASPLAPQEVLKRSDRARGNVKGIEWIIKIESLENKRRQKRSLRVKARGSNSLAEMIAPARVKGRKLLMLDRNMWFIKPGLRKPVPISPRQKLLGGASNGDIASTDYAGDYRISGVAEETVAEEACYRYDLVATDKNVTYDRIRYWISKARHVGVKSHFFTTSGKLFKTAEFEYHNRIEVNNEQVPFVSRMIIRNALIEDDLTVMTYHQIKVKKIPDATFNLNLLMQ